MGARSRVFNHCRSMFVGGMLCAGLYLTSWYSYLLFHSLAEMFRIVVACGMFLIVWNTRPSLNHPYMEHYDSQGILRYLQTIKEVSL